jgi:hypothetical protein
LCEKAFFGERGNDGGNCDGNAVETCVEIAWISCTVPWNSCTMPWNFVLAVLPGKMTTFVGAVFSRSFHVPRRFFHEVFTTFSTTLFTALVTALFTHVVTML